MPGGDIVSSPQGLAQGNAHGHGDTGYDANGLRTRRVEAGVETRYLLDGASVLEELDGAGATRTSFLNNPQAIDDVLAMNIGGQVAFPLTDALGSLYALTDSSGAIVRRQEFEVYGERTSSTGTGPATDRGFTNREHDAWGGVFNRDRERNPKLGSWLQPDRLGMADGQNLYQYVNGNPVMNTDPTGMFLTDFDSMNRACGVSLLNQWSRVLTYLQAQRHAYLSAVGRGNQTIDEIAEFLVEGIGPPLVFDMGPGLINGNMYAGTSWDLSTSTVSRVVVSHKAIDRGVEFLSHVLVHEAAHVHRFHQPGSFADPRLASAFVNTYREKSDWRSFNITIPYEGYWAESLVFGSLVDVH